jgi:hypothetical protein
MTIATTISALVLAVSSATPPPRATATPLPPGFAMVSVKFYQPDEVLQRRLNAVDALAAYIKKIVEVCSASLGPTAPPAALDVVVAVKPDKRARVWFVAGSPTRPGPTALASLRGQLEALAPPDVKEGPVAFAIIGSLGGATRPEAHRDDASFIPMPDEWRNAIRGKPNVLAPDGILALVWGD